ncbi:hypothetical protein TSAR_003648 [Trichomalopsis sarcophagae]|uniref:Uncharacterized protein n=1 Tax=Trichomalopsis sarcophagae TaxID=543379 RepID=A0A232FCF2_9HYME|nr:hypothetical protein TSAR_003648 [Trichomalopsis sarcophagae]
MDGGFLLHRVLWHQDQSVNSILNKYVTHVKKHYSKNSVIVFDRYPDVSENVYTKSAERERRITRQIGREVAFKRSMNITFTQESFLSNEKHKNAS